MKSDRAKRWGFILIFAGFAIGIPGILLMILPARYEAIARVNVSRDVPDTGWGTNGNVIYDPYFIQTECEVIKSEAVLKPVIVALRLDADWSRRYAIGRGLTENETINLLRQSLHLQCVRNTMLIDIGVISENPDEAAKIANAVAEACHNVLSEASEVRMEIIEVAHPTNVPIGHNHRTGKILLGVGVFLILAGVRMLWRNYFAAPRGALT